MWATLALGGLVTPAQVAGFTQDPVVELTQDPVVELTQDRVVELTQDPVVELMQDRGGLATQALVVKTLTLGIDLTQTVSKGVVCREFLIYLQVI